MRLGALALVAVADGAVDADMAVAAPGGPAADWEADHQGLVWHS